MYLPSLPSLIEISSGGLLILGKLRGWSLLDPSPRISRVSLVGGPRVLPVLPPGISLWTLLVGLDVRLDVDHVGEELVAAEPMCSKALKEFRQGQPTQQIHPGFIIIQSVSLAEIT